MRKRLVLILRSNAIFRIEHVMLTFHATTENIRTRVELSYSWQETEKKSRVEGELTQVPRVNLRWKGGQPKLPNGPDP